MRIVDKLITQIRRQTENENEAAIVNDEILQYLNDAQERLHARILEQHPVVFTAETEIDVSRGVSSYPIPDDAFLNNKIISVEYSDTGLADDYYNLDPITLKERTNYEGFPINYIRRNGYILLDPIPQESGRIRVNYVKRVSHLDTRRGVVDVAVLDTSTSSVSSLILDTSNSIAIDGDALGEAEYICIVDKNGNFKMKNIPVDSVDTGTGVVNISSGFTFNSGESISNGDYVVAGLDASTHSELPRNAERYLIAYASWKVLKRDSSADFNEQQTELLAMEDDLIKSYADVTEDFTRIPTYSSFDYWE